MKRRIGTRKTQGPPHSLEQGSTAKRGIHVGLFPTPKLSVPEFARLSTALARSRVIAVPLKRAIIRNAAKGYELVSRQGNATVGYSATLLNAILATDMNTHLDKWLAAATKASPDIYDKAMDSVYNASHIGGGQLHRLFDGSHTLWGAWRVTHSALPDDSILEETTGYLRGLWHDYTTTTGLPIATMDQATYDSVADFLQHVFHIPKPWFQDLLHVNAFDLLGPSIGILALALNWNRKNVRRFSEMCSGMSVAATISANPLLGIVALVALGKAFHEARQQGKDGYLELVEGLVKGGIVTGLVVGTSAAVGGPVIVGLLTGICVGVAANQALDKVELDQVSEFIASYIRTHVPIPGGV